VLSAETFVFLDHHVHAAAVAISKESTTTTMLME
jgi:hypothetical protein